MAAFGAHYAHLAQMLITSATPAYVHGLLAPLIQQGREKAMSSAYFGVESVADRLYVGMVTKENGEVTVGATRREDWPSLRVQFGK